MPLAAYLLWIALLPVACLGENAPSGQSGTTIVVPNQPQNPGRNSITIFDDRVFNVGDAPAAPTKSKTSKSASGSDRYYADDPDYNTGQRDQWLDSCESKKEDPKAYRDCYRAEKKKSREAVRRSVEDSERAGSRPVRNMPGGASLLEETKRDPSFGGVEIEKDND